MCLFHCACVTLNSTRTLVTLLMALFVKGVYFWLGLYPVVFLPRLAMPRPSKKKLSALERVCRFFRGEYTSASVRIAV